MGERKNKEEARFPILPNEISALSPTEKLYSSKTLKSFKYGNILFMKINHYDHKSNQDLSSVYEDISNLEAQVFESAFHSSADIQARLLNKNFLILIAEIEENPVGFKVGFEEKPDHFYSWIGGVISKFRGQGIAKNLMESQHTWLKNFGYKTVTTHTENQFKSMLILNLKFGFDVVGTLHVGDENYNRQKIVLRKSLV